MSLLARPELAVAAPLTGSLQNVSNMPPPISMTDQAFIEKLSEGVGRIQLARQRSSSLPPGEAAAQIKRIEEENGTKKSKIAEEVRKKKEEARAKERRQEKEKEKVMSHGEKELWESGDWRDHVKDLNASFSKSIVAAQETQTRQRRHREQTPPTTSCGKTMSQPRY